MRRHCSSALDAAASPPIFLLTIGSIKGRRPVESKRRFAFLPTMGLLLLLGFGGTGAISYFNARATLHRQLASTTLPLTAQALAADLERYLNRPLLVSSAMALNTYLAEWVGSGEHNQQEILSYLREVQRHFKATTAFFVSDRTGRYYHPNGVIKAVSPQDPADRWYYRVRNSTNPLELNIDRDTADRDRITAFSNYRVLDSKGHFIGAIGIGIELQELMKVLQSYQQRYGAEVLFLNRKGQVMLSPAAATVTGQPTHLQAMPGLSAHAGRILSAPDSSLQFPHGRGTLFVYSRQIPELDWVMVVLQQLDPQREEYFSILAQNLLIGLLVSGLLLLLANATVGNYQRRLELLATTDKLTGLLNRTAFEAVFSRLTQEASRRDQPLGVMLIDIDFFKRINDSHGHVVGDRVIRQMGELLRRLQVSGSAMFRWGGEEFLMLLPGFSASRTVEQAEQLRQVLRQLRVDPGQDCTLPTISCGVTTYQPGETEQELFLRADQALYLAKEEGRDRVVCLTGIRTPSD